MFGQSPVGRQVGVMPTPTRPENATPKTLVNFQPCNFAAIEYGDNDGHKRTVIVLQMGGVWYLAPNSETWANGVRPVSDWLAEKLDAANAPFVEKARGIPDTSIPATDTVDVLDGVKT